MAIVAAKYPASVWDRSTPSRPADRYIDREPNSRDWDQLVAEILACQGDLLHGIDGFNVDDLATSNLIGAVPVVHRVAVANPSGSTANVDVVLTHKTEITAVVVVKTTADGDSGDTLTVQNGANAVTDVMDLNVTDKSVVRQLGIDDAYATVAAGGTLRLAVAKASHAECIVYVFGNRVA